MFKQQCIPVLKEAASFRSEFCFATKSLFLLVPGSLLRMNNLIVLALTLVFTYKGCVGWELQFYFRCMLIKIDD